VGGVSWLIGSPRVLKESKTPAIQVRAFRRGVRPRSHPWVCFRTSPNLLTVHDAPTPTDQKLLVKFLEHRMRTFQGTFHASPDYALWYGWSEMQWDLTEIRELSAQMRREHARETARNKN
jgi:hypothetical protein